MKMLSNADLAAIRQRNDARAQGEWGGFKSVTCGHLRLFQVAQGHCYTLDAFPCANEVVWTVENVNFAAHASLDIPALLAMVDAQREEIEKRNELLRELGRRVLQHKRGCDAKYADAPEWYTGVVATPCTCDWDALRQRIQEATT